MTRRPSEYLPAGAWKNVLPFGGGACPNAAERPPVSEFESPKLKMAGNWQDSKQFAGAVNNVKESSTPHNAVCFKHRDSISELNSFSERGGGWSVERKRLNLTTVLLFLY